MTLAAEKDGTVTAFKVELLADLGAYISLVGGGISVLGAFMYNAIYKFPAYHFACQTLLTNKTWTDAYRGAGRPEATYAIERMVNELAHELGMDPLEVREKNWIKHEEFPFTTVAGLEYDSGNCEAATARAREMFGYDELRAEQQQRRDSGDPVQLGIGVSTFTEMWGLAPSRVLGSLDYGAGGWEHASVRMLPTGKVEVVTGISPHGQGHVTGFSQIVADRLGVPFEHVEILHGDTAVAHKGLDTYGSRSLVVGGEALVRAADKMIEKGKPFAAHLLEASVEDLEFSGGRFGVRGTDRGGEHPGVGHGHLRLYPEDMEPGLDADATFDPVDFSYPHGTHLCAVEVDTETGAVKLRKYVAVDDVGSISTRCSLRARSTAAWSRASPRRCGRRRSSTTPAPSCPARSSTTCCRPRPTRSRSSENTITPAQTNTLGTKGVGEAGAIAATPCVVNGIVDAIRHFGVDGVQMPCTPERVWTAVHAGDEAATEPEASAPHLDGEQLNQDGAEPQPDDAIDLGATVLPVLVRTYWKQALAGLVALLVVRRLLGRG